MHLQQLFLLVLLAASVALPVRAEALALDPAGRCLSANVDLRPAGPGGTQLYRIVFVNRCDQPRTFFWCAEHPAAALPADIACPQSQGSLAPAAELRHAIRLRKEFQWHLPAGARIRFHDCPGQEWPTPEFSCAPPAPSVRR